ncbi:MAG: hypothetical protein RLZZ436_3893 [Planctomycetota bacterium]|jgi:hypothetical protein
MSVPGTRPLPVVLIGASNLTLGWHSLLRQLRRACPGPLDVHIAAGMGRSYIKPARFAHRSLPSILDCGLWNAIPAADGPPRVLITDVGNDLAYGFEPEQIMESVEACVARIRAWRSDAISLITLPPLASLQSLGPARFRAARALLFPGSRLLLPDVLRLAAALAELLHNLGLKNAMSTLSPPAAWYGLDPIHIRRSSRATAFASMFASWGRGAAGDPDEPSTAVPAWPWLPTPAERQLFRSPRTTPQPVFSGPDLRISAW